jgi:HNH endonuclease
MDNSVFQNWSITNRLNDLPYSERVNIPALLQVFSKTSASYKYIYFLSLLDILERTNFNQLVIHLDDILLEMLANAWFPHNYFKLSFGVNDRIARELDRLNIPMSGKKLTNAASSKKRLKSLIAGKDYTQNHLLDMVPYRLLTPFFSSALRRLTDTKRNKKITELAYYQFETAKPFYIFSDDGRSIIMNPEWMLYFYENQKVVRSFVCWNWLDYMQRRNPSVPNLQMKLFPPTTRNSLSMQTRFWKEVLQHKQLTCIFSGKPLNQKDISIDHFLPWSFVAHDQLWNLVPVSKSINSSKSNNLPSLERYFEKFVDLQYNGLTTYNNIRPAKSWNKVVESYISDLKLKPDELLDKRKLMSGLRTTIEPLEALASAQGFSGKWVYG